MAADTSETVKAAPPWMLPWLDVSRLQLHSMSCKMHKQSIYICHNPTFHVSTMASRKNAVKSGLLDSDRKLFIFDDVSISDLSSPQQQLSAVYGYLLNPAAASNLGPRPLSMFR